MPEFSGKPITKKEKKAVKSLVHGLVKTAEDYLQSPKGSTKSNKSGESPRTSVKGKGNSNDFFDILMLIRPV